MFFSKYDQPKTKAGSVISETTVSRIEKQVDEIVVQKAQQTAATDIRIACAVLRAQSAGRLEEAASAALKLLQ